MAITLCSRVSSFAFALTMVLVLIGGCSNSPEKLNITPNSSAGEHVHEILRFGVKGQQCEVEKTQYLETHKTDLIQNVDILFSDLPKPHAPNPTRISEKLKWFQNEKIELVGDQLARLLRTNAAELGNNLHQLVGDVPLSALSDEMIWQGVELAKRDEWPKLEKSIREGLVNIGEHKEELKEIQEIFSRLKNHAQSPEGQVLYTRLTTDLESLMPSDESLWNILLFAKRDELPLLARRLQAEIDTLVQADPNRTEFLNILVKLRDFILSENGAFLYETMIKNVASQNDEQILKALHFVQKPDVAELAKRFSGAAGKIQSPSENSTNILLNFAKGFTEEELWEFVLFLQRKEVGTLFQTLEPYVMELENPTKDETKLLLWNLKKTYEQISSPEALAAGRVFFEYLHPDASAAESLWKALQFIKGSGNRYLLKSMRQAFSDEKVAAAIARVRDFAFSEKGLDVMSYAKKFITDAKTRDFMFKLIEYGANKHGAWGESLGLSICLGEQWRWGGQSGRKLCAWWLKDLGPDMVKEALDIGAIAYQAGVLDDLFLIEATFKNFYAKHRTAIDLCLPAPASTSGAPLASDFKAKVEVFFNDAKRANAAKFVFELLFDKGLGEQLAALGDKALQIESKNRYAYSQVEALASDYKHLLNRIKKEHVTQILELARDQSLVSLASLLFEHRRDFELVLSLAEELGVHPKQLTKEQVSQFVAFITQGDHVRAAGILYDIAQRKEVRDDGRRFYALLSDFFLKHKSDIELIKALNNDFGIPPNQISLEHVKRFMTFIRSQENQETAKLIFEMATNTNILQDLLRLNQLSVSFLKACDNQIALLRSLKQYLGLSLDRISEEKFFEIIDYVKDEANQKAAQGLFGFTMETVGFLKQARNQLTQSNSTSAKSLSQESTKQVFATIHDITRADVAAATKLARVGFDLWSMTPDNQCQASNATHIQPKEFQSAMNRIADFLTDSQSGFRSWLSLFRRVAQDHV